MKITRYTLKKAGFGRKLCIALVPDIHDSPHDGIVKELSSLRPDMIAVAGDLMQNIGREDDGVKGNERGFDFLKKASGISPTFYSLGNHEAGITEENAKKVRQSGAVLLDDAYTVIDGIVIGGLSSKSHHGHVGATPSPSLGWLDKFESEDGLRILLCHHPEYYPEYLADRNIDVVLSGHAHGGQWRIFGHGIYAPGQGLFPKLTSGIHDGRLVVSRGIGNHVKIPRIFNSPEIVLVTIE